MLTNNGFDEVSPVRNFTEVSRCEGMMGIVVEDPPPHIPEMDYSIIRVNLIGRVYGENIWDDAWTIPDYWHFMEHEITHID